MTAPAALSPTCVRDAARYAEQWVRFQQRLLRVPGVQVAVWYDGEVVLSSACGVADLRSGTPLTSEHLFRIASHSKTVTATAVMQLVEAGALRLDDPVQQWLPALAGAPVGALTLHQLLSHTGGATRDGADSDHWQLMQPFHDAQGLQEAALAAGAAVLAPDERFKYSNITYSLLGAVVEAVSGQPYAAYVTEHVVDRLGLTRTGPELDRARAGEYATGHTSLTYADERLPIEHVDTRAMAAATGFFSTAEDVVRYAAAHLLGDERLLTDASKRRMQRAVAPVDDEGPESYALGWGVSELGGRRLLGHGGGYPGHITSTLFDPEARLVVSVFTNAIDGPAAALARGVVRLVDLAARAEAELRDQRARGLTPSTADPEAAFEGRFAGLWGVEDVVELGGRLLVVDPALPDPAEQVAWLTVVDDRTLQVERQQGYGSPGEHYRYEHDHDGTVRAVRGPGGTSSWPIEVFAAALAGRDRIDLASGGAGIG